jgi:hypothetical protein
MLEPETKKKRRRRRKDKKEETQLNLSPIFVSARIVGCVHSFSVKVESFNVACVCCKLQKLLRSSFVRAPNRFCQLAHSLRTETIFFMTLNSAQQ